MRKIKLLLAAPLLAAPLAIVVSCSSKPLASRPFDGDPRLAYTSSGYGENVTLSGWEYNSLYDKLGPNDVALAIIANHKIYEQVIPMQSWYKVWDVMLQSNFEFKKHDTPGLGVFVNSFRPKGTTEWLHGTRIEQNYGDYYPLYYVNHRFANLGVSNWTVRPREVYEFCYDDK